MRNPCFEPTSSPWKLLATACISVLLMAACGAQEPASSGQHDARAVAAEAFDELAPARETTEKPAGYMQGAPAPAQASVVNVVPVADGLEVPWSLAFLPDGQALVTERPGRLRRVDLETGVLSEPISGLPEVFANGQGGLLDVVLSPDFERDQWIYLSYAEAGEEGRAGTALGRGKLVDGALQDWEVLFRQTPKLSTGHHFGSRIVFDRDGYLFLALGENNQRPTAQMLDHLQGKLIRLHPDGRIPADNPFVGRPEARPEIWSYGHRNQQGAALHPLTGQIWTSEHGPRGGDEINIPAAGKNHGWPLATYGINYSGDPIPEARGTHVEGTEQPHYWFERSPGLSGMAFYVSERFPAWKNSLFLGGLATRDLIRLQLDDAGRVLAEERLLGDQSIRVRDVRQSPDGFLYLLSESDGRILRIDRVPDQASELANPASEYCLEKGGRLEIVQAEGGEQGLCHLSDGTVVEEWALFRRDHPQD